MNKLVLKNVLRFIFLIGIQVLVLNNVLFMNYINPYIYILFILLLPFDTARWLLLVLSFALGFSVDAFQNTMGLHAFSCVFIAFIRRPILYFLLPQIRNKNKITLSFSTRIWPTKERLFILLQWYLFTISFFFTRKFSS